jgi:hypothetical protein
VEDPLIVGVLKRLADSRNDRQRLCGREPSGLHRLAQVHAIDVFHEEKAEPVRLAEIVNAYDVGVTESREHPAFAVEPLGEERVAGQPIGKNLQGHQPVEVRLPRLVDEPHAPVADELLDLQLWECGSNLFERGDFQSSCKGAFWFCGRGAGQHAPRTKPLGGFRGDPGSAPGTGLGHWFRIHAPGS